MLYVYPPCLWECLILGPGVPEYCVRIRHIKHGPVVGGVAGIYCTPVLHERGPSTAEEEVLVTIGLFICENNNAFIMSLTIPVILLI